MISLRIRVYLLLTLLIALYCSLYGCGSGSMPQDPENCLDIYSQPFCDSLRGPQGDQGSQGDQGPMGIGEDGVEGPSGPSGEVGEQGNIGEQGPEGEAALVEIIDPCGKEADFDEVLIRFSDNNIYAVYVNKKEIFLTILEDGDYTTTDDTDCDFTVEDGEVLW